MWQLGPLGIAAPLALLGLASLPLLWLLLRRLPRAVRNVRLPSIHLLPRAPDPPRHRQPPLLRLLVRLVLVLAGVLATAGLLWQPPPPQAGGALQLIIDNRWHEAAIWPQTLERARRWIAFAEQARQPVIVQSVAAPAPWLQPPAANGRALAAADAARLLDQMQPLPWSAAAAPPPTTPEVSTAVVIASGMGEAAPLEALLDRSDKSRRLWDQVPASVAALRRVSATPAGWRAELARAAGLPAQTHAITVTDAGGVELGRAEASFGPGDTSVAATIAVPLGERRRAARLELPGPPHAGARWPLDQAARRPVVGLVEPAAARAPSPLQSPAFYLRRALGPSADLLEGDAAGVIARGAGLVVLIDPGRLAPDEEASLKAFAGQGGVILAFAGPRSAAQGYVLAPTPLRPLARAMGGALSWGSAQAVAPGSASGPLAGIAGLAEIAVRQQVLAEPSALVAGSVWLALTDGTPFLTAAPLGDGLSLFVHSALDPDWSTLALSGAFVTLMDRLAGLGAAGAALTPDAGPARLTAWLDGFGGLVRYAGRPIEWSDAPTGPDQPPGLYGAGSAVRFAGLAAQGGAVPLFGPLPHYGELARAQPPGAADTPGTPLGPWLLLLFAVLALADLFWEPLVALARRLAVRAPPLTALVLLALMISTGPASAQSERPEVELGYIETGSAANDALVRDGLAGLARMLALRTAVQAATPRRINPARDDPGPLALLYWRPLPGSAPPNAAASQRLRSYLAMGGLMMIDLSRGADARTLLAPLQLPPLSQATAEHIVLRSFYLLPAAPGLHGPTPLWIDARSTGPDPGVSAVLLGSGDWARAWAIDPQTLESRFAAPAGERQRELASRFGINAVIYALTGTYKGDQVHLPELLERTRRR